MRKVFYFSVIFLLGFALFIFFKKPIETASVSSNPIIKKNAESFEVSDNEPTKIPRPTQRVPVKSHENRLMAQSATKSIHARSDLTASFEVKDLPGTTFEVVTNFIGIKSDEKSSKGFLAGYQLQDASDGDQLNLLLNKETGKYGVWSGEIIVTGNEEAIDQLQQKLNLERVNKNSDRVMFRVPEQVRVEDIVGHPGLVIEPDVIYSRVSAI